eukprot:2285702-Prymnesium_polylepis.1
MTELTLRLRLPTGPTTVKIAKDATFAQLRALVASAASTSEESFALSSGFPPSPLQLEDDAPIAASLHDMDTVVVTLGATTGQAVATGKPPAKRQKKAAEPKKAAAAASSSAAVCTLSDLGSGSGSPAPPSSSKKRAPPSSSGGGGGGGGGKRRAAALQLSSEDGIGSSLLGAVSGSKHSEDPASAFLKAASKSALVHHMEEVVANERFQAALGGHFEVAVSESSRRADGEPTEATVKFKVGRKWKEESFTLLALPELRGVLLAVLEQLQADPSSASVELLKPFKM